MKFLEKYRGKPLRFILAGVVNSAFGLAIYPILVLLLPKLHYMVVLLIAQFLSIIFAFFTYKIGVFRTKARIIQEFLTFSSFYIVNFAANWAALPVLVEFLHIKPMIGQLAFSFMVIVSSYFWHSRLTFRSSEVKS